MTKDIVTVQQRRDGVWCVAFNGTIPGDSRGFLTREQAVDDAKRAVARIGTDYAEFCDTE